jgi:hypothetical protein
MGSHKHGVSGHLFQPNRRGLQVLALLVNRWQQKARREYKLYASVQDLMRDR